MIVKNEAAVIRRCLESVKPIIDYWIICDTGSTDNTREIIRDTLRDVPGSLYEDAWIDFGHNRNLAISRARGRADYHLLIDADTTLSIAREFRHSLDKDAYLIEFTGPLRFSLPMLISDKHQWEYRGVTHEYIYAETAKTRAALTEVIATHYFDGASRAEKFQRDLHLLTTALEKEPENSRYMFYLAETYRAIGLMAQAIEWYSKRAAAGGWEEEVFYSLYQIARLKHLSTLPWSSVLPAYLEAYQYRPTRLEPLYPVARFYREAGQFHLAYLFSRPILEHPPIEDILFIDRPVYDYLLPLEHSISCQRLGKYEESIGVADTLISRGDVPAEVSNTARRIRELSLAAMEVE